MKHESKNLTPKKSKGKHLLTGYHLPNPQSNTSVFLKKMSKILQMFETLQGLQKKKQERSVRNPVRRTFNPLSGNPPHKMVKHTQTIHRLLPTNCLSVFDHFVGLALEGLRPCHTSMIECLCKNS